MRVSDQFSSSVSTPAVVVEIDYKGWQITRRLTGHPEQYFAAKHNERGTALTGKNLTALKKRL
jgi:hypothetical protein